MFGTLEWHLRKRRDQEAEERLHKQQKVNKERQKRESKAKAKAQREREEREVYACTPCIAPVRDIGL
jgi:hypothetical protein